MWRMLAVMRRNLQNIRKSPRVADENMLGVAGSAELPILVHDINRTSRRGWNAFSVIYSVVRAPLSIVACFSQPHINGADGVWVSGEFAQISEMNHLMMKGEPEKIAMMWLASCPYLVGHKKMSQPLQLCAAHPIMETPVLCYCVECQPYHVQL